MNDQCPSCRMQINLGVMDIVDEKRVQCPHCFHYYKIYLSPKTKQIMEMCNQEALDYMLAYPHEEKSPMNQLPSGVLNTFE